MGAGSVFLNTDYDAYILADINSDLINLYNIVKLRTDDFVRDARTLFADEFNNSDQFYLLREEFNTSTEPYRRALLFLYLNRHCYNGLCRYNLRGEFNVPFGRYKKPYFPEEELYWFAEKSRNATFVCEHYRDTMAKAVAGAWCIAIRLTRRCRRRRISPLTTPTASASPISRVWRIWRTSSR